MAKVGFRTDLGKVRQKNEDALLVAGKYGVFVVADGVGGQSSGELASRRAINTIEEYLKENPITKSSKAKDKDKWLLDYFLECFKKIDRDILKIAEEDPGKEGMATTAVLAHVNDSALYVVNVGDSRAYIIRDAQIAQITEDHTYVNSLVQTGDLTKSEAAEHPQKNIITKALGTGEDATPDLYEIEVHKGDRVLLCTDGLHGELSDEEILKIVEKENDMNSICKDLVESAIQKGGRDNITVVCIEI